MHYLHRINQVVKDTDYLFWQNWMEATKHFPDTEDGIKIEMIALEAVFTSLIGRYVLAFPEDIRKEFFRDFLQNLKRLEDHLF